MCELHDIVYLDLMNYENTLLDSLNEDQDLDSEISVDWNFILAAFYLA